MKQAQLLLLSLFACTSALNCQQWIDGATNPEKIPDSRAYIFLFQALAPGPSELASSYLKRAQGYVNDHTSLDEAERGILLDFSNAFYLAGIELANQRNIVLKAGHPSSNAEVLRLRVAYEDKALTLGQALKSRLSVKGRETLEKHIAYIKAHSRIVAK